MSENAEQALQHLTSGEAMRQLSQHESVLRFTTESHIANQRVSLADRYEFLLHMNGNADPANPETAAALRFISENGGNVPDFIHVQYLQSIQTAKNLAEACRNGDYEGYSALLRFTEYAVPLATACITKEEMIAWAQKFPAPSANSDGR